MLPLGIADAQLGILLFLLENRRGRPFAETGEDACPPKISVSAVKNYCLTINPLILKPSWGSAIPGGRTTAFLQMSGAAVLISERHWGGSDNTLPSSM